MQDYIKKTKDYYNKEASNYHNSADNWQLIEWLEKFTSLISDSARVLDLGCAYGRDVQYFFENGFDIYGFDISEEMIGVARTKIPKAKFKVGNLLELDYEDDYFDGVWSSATLVHISRNDIDIAIKQINRVLKREGILYLTFREGEGEALDKNNNKERYYSYYKKQEIYDFLEKNGFIVVEYEEVKKETRKHKSIYLIARKVG